MRKLSLITTTVFLPTLLALSLPKAFAACHTVSPTGSGAKTGVDWNNAYAGLPATLVRGDVYYLADGSYGSYNFNTADSGTTTVEIRKAQSYDNCTSVGWNGATMGNSQAVFSKTTPSAFSVSKDYFIVNGNGRQASQGCGGPVGTSYEDEPSTPMDCGIRIDASGCAGSGSTACNADGIALNGVHNISFNYVEVVGNANNSIESALIGYFGGANTVSVLHMFGRAAGCVYFIPVGNNQSVGYSYFWYTATSAADTCHPQYSSSFGTNNNDVEYNNIYRDINGSAVFSFTNPNAGNHTGMVYYNNVFWQTSGNPYTTSGLDDGIVGVLQGTVTDMVFVHNTMINLSGWATGFYQSSSGQSGTIENNIWYNSGKFSLGNGTWTEDHNSFLGTTCPSSLGVGDVCVASSPPDPFVNWTASNFNIADENSAWTSLAPQSAPYTTDANGNTFTTDRGAYEIRPSAITLSGSLNVQ